MPQLRQQKVEIDSKGAVANCALKLSAVRAWYGTIGRDGGISRRLANSSFIALYGSKTQDKLY